MTIGGDLIVVANVHLAADEESVGRVRQIERLWSRVESVAQRLGVLPIVSGDFNDLPGGPAVSLPASHGLVDSWQVCRPGETGATNWTPGNRSGRAPTQRLDYVFVPPLYAILDVRLPDESAYERFSGLSDHLPLTVRLATH